MKKRERSYPKPAGSVLFETLKRMGLSSALARQSIVSRWPNIVDSVVARHARAERLMGDTLYVVVDSSVWMNELSAIKMVLLDKLNSKLGRDVPKIEDIKFRQIAWRSVDVNNAISTSRSSSTTLPPDEAVLEVSTRSIHAIKNEEIRDIVERLIQKDAYYKANRSDDT